jgi:hypothetical protein
MKKKLNNTFVFLLLFLLSCKNDPKKETTPPYKDIVTYEEAMKILDTIKADKNYIPDNIIYEKDNGFNKIEAQKAEEFVLTKLDLKSNEIQLYETGFNTNDSSYHIQTGINDKENNKVWFSFYIYYPKTYTIIHGVNFDTLFHKNKLYKNHVQ